MSDKYITPEFFAGICNGIVQNTVGHPFDTLKVLIQNRVSIKNITLSDMYRGYKYPLYNQILTNSFALDLHSKLKIKGIKNEFINGAVIGGAITPFAFFFDVLKIKRQNEMKYCFKDFIKPISFGLTLSREVIAYSLYFGSYFEMRKRDIHPGIAGGLAGCLNWTLTYPMDTIRTRYITFDKTLLECVLMQHFWKGYNICMVRAFLVSSFGFTAYEYSLKLIKNVDFEIEYR